MPAAAVVIRPQGRIRLSTELPSLRRTTYQARRAGRSFGHRTGQIALRDKERPSLSRGERLAISRHACTPAKAVLGFYQGRASMAARRVVTYTRAQHLRKPTRFARSLQLSSRASRCPG
ncbi:hypothetical protein MRX96_053168 [Rhipicephalus microplus]